MKWLPMMRGPVVLPIEHDAGRGLAGQVDRVIDEGIVHKSARDLDDVVAPRGHGGQRVFHEQLDGVVAGEAHLLRDAEPLAGQAHVGRAVAVDPGEDRDHHPRPGRRREGGRPQIGQDEQPAVRRDRARPSLEQDAIAALGQDDLGIVDSAELARARRNS